MINIIRKYNQVLMILITVLIIIAFVWLYNSPQLERQQESAVAKAWGRDVTREEVERYQRRFTVAMQLGLYELIGGITDLGSQRAFEDFLWHGLILQREAKRLEIEPTSEQLIQQIKELPAFQTGDQFDPQKYGEFVQMALAPRGFSETQLEDLVRDQLRLQRLKALIGSTVGVSPTEFRAAYDQRYQQMEIAAVRFERSAFEQGIEIPQEELQAAFEQRKDALNTEETRRVKFAHFPLTEEQKQLKGRDRVEVLQGLVNKATEFTQEMLREGAKFEEVAQRYQATVGVTEPFTNSAPPPAFGASAEPVAAAFKLTKEQPDSDVVQTRENGFYVLKLEEILPARPLTFEEAQPQLAEQLKREKAMEKMNLRASEVRAKLEEDLKAGKSLAEAAQAQGVTVDQLPPVALAKPNFDKPDSQEIITTAIDLKAGELSQPVPTANGMVLVHVARRNPVDEKEFEREKEPMMNQFVQGKREAVFREWLRQQRQAAGIRYAGEASA